MNNEAYDAVAKALALMASFKKGKPADAITKEYCAGYLAILGEVTPEEVEAAATRCLRASSTWFPEPGEFLDYVAEARVSGDIESSGQKAWMKFRKALQSIGSTASWGAKSEFNGDGYGLAAAQDFGVQEAARMDSQALDRMQKQFVKLYSKAVRDGRFVQWVAGTMELSVRARGITPSNPGDVGRWTTEGCPFMEDMVPVFNEDADALPSATGKGKQMLEKIRGSA